MAKVLFISGIEIFPPQSGGQLRSSNLAMAISKNHSVNIYSLTGRKSDYLKLKASGKSQITENLSEYTNRNPLYGMLQFISYQLKLPPFWLTILLLIYLPKDLNKQLNEAEIIILDFPFLYPIFKKAIKAKKILNTHNAEFNLYQNSTLKKLVKKIETNAFSISDKIFFCSEIDQKQFAESLYENKSMIVPNGIDLNQYTKIDYELNSKIKNELKIKENSHVFIFTGSRYKPNFDAFKRLLEFTNSEKEFLEKNNIVILIVGSVSDQLINDKHLKITGRVESIIPYLQISDFALNNIDSGSGTNVKMFEYIASNLTILSTEFGTRGFSLVANVDYINIDQGLKIAFQNAVNLTKEDKDKLNKSAFIKNQNILKMDNHLKDIL